MILIYITCKDVEEAENIGSHLMSRKLCGCFNIVPGTKSSAFWPPKFGKVEKSNEAVLLVKTIEEKYKEIEGEIVNIHSYELPCIFSIKVNGVYKKYEDWLIGEIEK
jgi:periplasmic divalent cation tolerance protein